jgi:putative drug exporter of the RND superfamily
MTNGLARIGELMFKLKWWVVAFWVVVLAALAVVVLQVGPKTTSSISIPGTQAQQALDRFNELFPEAGASSAKVVVAAPEGKVISDYTDEITTLTSDISEVNEVSTSLSPFDVPNAVSEDGRIGFITVQLKPEGETVDEQTINDVRALINEARQDGLTVEAGGDLVSRELGEILGVGEIAGVVIALVVLLMTLGSLIAAGMPIITAIIAVGVSMAALFSFSNVIELTNTAPVLAVMLGLAVGIDYSLFIVNRYRTFVHEGYSLSEAAARTIATAGNAVIFAAATVVIALVSLSVVQIPFMTVMGVSAAATVAIAALIAITLIPALLGIAKLRIFGRKARREIVKIQKSKTIHEEAVNKNSIWYKWGVILLRFRFPILALALGLVVLISLPAAQLRLSLPTDETAAPGSSAKQAYDLLAEGFGAGYNGPLLVVAEGLPETTEADIDATRQQIISEYQKQLQAQGPEAAMAMASPEAQQAAAAQLEAQVAQYAPLYQAQKVADRIAEDEGVETAQAALSTDNGTKAVIQVTPKSGPSDEATQKLVASLRDESRQRELTNSDTINLIVTGTTALQIDVNEKLADALPVYLIVVVGLSLIILMLAFRSILIPFKATLGFLLSVFAMFGALVAVFQWGWFGITDAPGPIVSFIPIIAIGILFGLAMDYEFFLVSGMQEAYHKTKDAKKAVLQGYALGSRVVVAAGLIMVSVFAGFISNHDATIQSVGFALALGILVDAFIVRMIIVPIIMSLLGRSAWWIPKWLDKILPKVSIEGEAK